MKSWLFIGAKVTPLPGDGWWNWTNPGHLDLAPVVGEVYTVTGIEDYRGVVIFSTAERPASTWFDPRDFAPVTTINTDATVAALAKLTVPGRAKVRA